MDALKIFDSIPTARCRVQEFSLVKLLVVGLTGPFIDERIAGVASGTGAGPVRATWNATTKRFELTTSGTGYTSFHLGGAVGTSPATETRSTGQKFASGDPWVWDYESEETVVVVAKPVEVMTAFPDNVAQTPKGQPGPRRLLQPEFSRRSGLFEFDFRLLSTVNRGVSADEDADAVWIPTLASQMTSRVQGQTFYLQLRFGNSTRHGFTTIDEFHVHENKSATVSIYGKFTTNPVF
jgi:hypothetical protein